MAIDKTALLGLIAQNPEIRTVEIAEVIDCEPDQVQPALQSWIDRGDIIVHNFTALSGKPINGFECSARFAQSDVYKALLNVGKDKEAQKEAAPGSPELTDTYVNRAIAFVRENRSVTNRQMKVHLRLPSYTNISQHLKRGIEDKLLAHSGVRWTLGAALIEKVAPEPKSMPAPIAEPVVEKSAPVESTLPIPATGPKKQVDDAPQQSAETPAPKPAPNASIPTEEPMPAPTSETSGAAPSFACAIWSTGELSLVRGGEEMKLSAAETRQMCDYLDRLTEAA